MAQTNRDLNEIIAGVSEEVKQSLNFDSERRSEVINSLNEKNEARIKEIAKVAVRENDPENFSFALQELINHYSNSLDKSSQNSENVNYAKKYKTILEIFNQEVEKLQQQKNEKSEPVNDEEKFTQELKEITEKIYNKEKNLIFNFVDEPIEYYQELEDYIKNNNSIPDERKNLIKKSLLDEKSEKLRKYFGQDSYDFYYFYCKKLNENIEKLSHQVAGTEEFTSTYSTLKNLIVGMMNASQDKDIEVSFDEETQTLNISFPYNIIKKVEKQVVSKEVLNYLNIGSLTDEQKKEKEIQSFREQCESFISVYYEDYEKTILTLENTLDLNILDSQLSALIADKVQFSLLTKEEKTSIINEIEQRYNNEKINKYGEGFIEYLQNVIINNLSQIPFDDLSACEYGTEDFNQCYDKVYDGLQKLIDAISGNAMSSKFLKDISYDDKTQKLIIKFTNENVPTYEKQIMSNEAVLAIRNEKNSKSTNESNINIIDDEFEKVLEADTDDFVELFNDEPDISEPNKDNSSTPDISEPNKDNSSTPDIPENNNQEKSISDPTALFTTTNPTTAKESFVARYLMDVEVLNNFIAMLNDFNRQREASFIFENLDSTNLENAISLEKRANELDQKIIDIKLELAKKRFEFKNKYNEYILAIPAVKNAQINEIEFTNKNLADFVSLADEQLALAENKVIELNEERQNSILDNEKISAITTQINTIMSFIESQNSLIARRIIVESANKDFDIVGFLKTRREKKKEIREKIKMSFESSKTTNVNSLESENLEIKESNGIPIPNENQIPSIEANPILNSNEENTILANSTVEEEFEVPVIAEMTEENLNIGEIPEISEVPVIAEIKEDNLNIDATPEISEENSEVVKNEEESTQELVEENSDTAKTAEVAQTQEISDDDIVPKLDKEYTYEDISKMLDDINDRTPVEPEQKEQEEQEEQEVKTTENDDIKETSQIEVDDLVETLGYEIINSYNATGTIVREEFDDNYLSDAKITKEAYDKALDILQQLNVINLNDFTILPTMNKDEFEQVILEHRPNAKNEPKTPQVHIELKILTLNPVITTQKVNRSKGLITSGDVVTISLIKNGIKVKYSEELRTKLSDLKAKLHLINKDNSHIRTSTDISDDLEQELKFKDGRNINPEEYKVAIKAPNESDPILEFDLANTEEEEHKHTL